MKGSAVMIEKVVALSSAFDFHAVTRGRVEAALAAERRSAADLGALLSPAAAAYLEPMARLARDLTHRFFGRNIGLYTPLYIANHCVNECVYCGYNRRNDIRRAGLTFEEIEAEAEAVAASGLREILLLTGESRTHSNVEYIAEAVKILRGRFSCVGIEVYPLDTAEYRLVHEAGADYVSVYQETYDPALYEQVHLSGPKRNYAYRFQANDRALAAGFRGASFGALLGLGDFRRDVLACAFHAALVSEKRPWAEIGFSVPRLRPFPNREKNEADVRERELMQIILALRLFMPWASISLSTRERAEFRDNCLGLGITRLSAGVSTGIGGRCSEEKGDQQFHTADGRGVAEIEKIIAARGYQPVFNDYVRV